MSQRIHGCVNRRLRMLFLIVATFRAGEEYASVDKLFYKGMFHYFCKLTFRTSPIAAVIASTLCPRAKGVAGIQRIVGIQATAGGAFTFQPAFGSALAKINSFISAALLLGCTDLINAATPVT